MWQMGIGGPPLIADFHQIICRGKPDPLAVGRDERGIGIVETSKMHGVDLIDGADPQLFVRRVGPGDIHEARAVGREGEVAIGAARHDRKCACWSDGEAHRLGRW